MSEKKTGLDLLREPFPDHQISKLPKPTKQQTEALKAAMDRKDFSLGIKCTLCGAWHHKDAVHFDYVGHAALTHRLLDADPSWQWQPMALVNGLPAFDQSGGLWIKLTVCGVERLGYGHAAGKSGQDPGAREKEVIGDALRNAAMRFGAALDLWHKGDLHAPDDGDDEKPEPRRAPMIEDRPRQNMPSAASTAAQSLSNANSIDQLAAIWADIPRSVQGDAGVIAAKDKRKAELTPPKDDLDGDHIPDQGAK